MIAAILGFMPAADRRFNIAIRSGTAAKVVPRPAMKPKISERWSFGMSRLAVSRGVGTSQPQSTNTAITMQTSINSLRRIWFLIEETNGSGIESVVRGHHLHAVFLYGVVNDGLRFADLLRHATRVRDHAVVNPVARVILCRLHGRLNCCY